MLTKNILFESFFYYNKQFYIRYLHNNEVHVDPINVPKYYYIKSENGNFKDLLTGESLQQYEGYNNDLPYKYDPVSNVYKFIRYNIWNSVKYNPNPRVFTLDIETRSELGVPDVNKAKLPVVSIQIYDNIDNVTYYIGTRKYNNSYDLQDKTLNDTVKCIYCQKEEDIFEEYFNLLAQKKPLFVLAHYGSQFDYPYLYNRCKNLSLDPNRFSPFGSVEIKKFMGQKGRMGLNLLATGVFYMDTIDIYKKFNFKAQSSYSLDNLCYVHLRERKLKYNHEFDSIDDFYQGNYNPKINKFTDDDFNDILWKTYEASDKQVTSEVIKIAQDKFIKYSVIDVQKLYRLIHSQSLVKQMISIAEKMGVLPNDTLGTIKGWTNFILNTAYYNGLVLEEKEYVHGQDTSYEGGYVRETKVGKFDWLMSLDVNSMYPNILVAYNMSSETFIPHDNLPEELKEYVKKYFSTEDEDKIYDMIITKSSIIKEYNNLLQKYNLCGTFTGAIFRKDKQGLIPGLVSEIYSNRKNVKAVLKTLKSEKKRIQEQAEKEKIKLNRTYVDVTSITPKDIEDLLSSDCDINYAYNVLSEKIEELDLEQIILKIMINSLYGALGTVYFLLYNKEIAKAITGQGRLFIKIMAEKGNSAFNKLLGDQKEHDFIVAGDTDSVYYSLAPLVNKFIKDDDISKKLKFMQNLDEKLTSKIVQAAVNEMMIFNLYDRSVIDAKREIIGVTSLFIAKKKYIIAVIDDEGVEYLDNYKLKMTGVEMIKSSTPKYIKEILTDVVPIILFNKSETLIRWLSSKKSEFMTQRIADISKITTVNSLNYIYDKKNNKFIARHTNAAGRKLTAPINSTAALVFNKYIEEHKIPLNHISEGDKIFTIYLKENNPFYNSKILGFIEEDFPEDYRDVIDFDTNWEKYVVSPIDIMIKPLGWNTKHVSILDDDW